MTLITCRLYSSKSSALNVSSTFRAEDFHHAKISMECVEMSIAIGNAGITTLLYVSHDEWARILPLLTGESAPVQAPTDTQEFRRLMYTWHRAQAALNVIKPPADYVEAEKEAYAAVVAYIKNPPPALPLDVMAAYAKWETDFQSNRYTNGVIAAIQNHLPDHLQGDQS